MCQKPILTLFNKLLLLVLMISPVHASDNTLTPLEHFARLPIVKKPVVSPNGKRIAFTMMIKGKPQLIVRELLRSGGKKPEPVVPINAEDYFFHHYTWANDNRLVASIRATQAINGSLYNFTRLGSIGRKGENPVLFKMRPNPWGYYRQSARLISRLKDDPDHILATVDDNPKRWAAPEVHRINIKTGEKTLVQSNRLGIRRWLVDANGRVRIGVKYSAKPGSRDVTIYYQEKSDEAWKILQKVDYFNYERLVPYRFDEDDPNILLVAIDSLDMDQEENDEDERQLFRYDLTQKKVLGPYENAYRKKVLAIVKKALPERQLKIVSRDTAKKIYLFKTYKDTMAPEYYVLDLNRKKLEFLGQQYPELADTELSAMQTLSYSARDGLEIPAFLTIPTGLYQCGISINGIHNLSDFMGDRQRLLYQSINRTMLNKAEDVKTASPYHLAKNIRSPLLLIGSERDTIVPVTQSRAMYKKLEKLKKAVEYIELPDGEHWRTNEKHEIAKLKALERFLNKYIGKAG